MVRCLECLIPHNPPNNNNSNLYSAFLNTQRRFTWGEETVTNRTKKKESRQNKQTGHIGNNKKGKQTGEAVWVTSSGKGLAGESELEEKCFKGLPK